MVNQLPQGWKEEELGKLADVIAGQSPEGIYYNTVGDGTPFYQGKSEFQEMYLGKPTKWTTKVTKLAKRNDILMSVRAPVGPVNITQEDICIGRGLAAITAKSMLLQLYLFYHLRYLEDKISGTNGAVFASISKREIEQIKITYPTDKDEQQYIVKTLDAVAEMIKLRKETIKLTKDLIPAIFQEMFGDFRGDEPIKKHVIVNPPKASLNNNEKVSFLSMADVSVDGYISSSQRRCYSDVRNGFSSFINDDIILAKITPCYENGKGAIVRDLINGIGFGSTEFYVLRCDKQYILPEYLFYLLRSDDFMELGKCHMKGDAGQKRLDKLFLQNFGITYPSLSQQKEFAKKVEQINKYIVAQQEELEHFETLFQSLLQEAFTGVLTWKYPRKESND